ncbi:MAG: GAF domain-containing protein, partial [Candidatus Viridilinea halotolerans]
MIRRVARTTRLAHEQRRKRQQQRDQQVLAALYRISLACRGRPSFQTIFTTIQAQLADVFAFDAAYIALCGTTSGQFRAALLVDEDLSEFLEQIAYGPLTGQIIQTGQPLLFRDLVAEQHPHQAPDTFGNNAKLSRAWMGVPLLIDTAAVGVISLQSYRVGNYRQRDLDLLQRMANVIAVALQNVTLLENQANLQAALEVQITARTAELSTLQAIAAGLTERQPLTVMLERVITEVVRLFRLDAGNVRLIDFQREQLVLYAQHGFPPAYAERTTYVALAHSPIRDVVTSRQPQIVTHGWREFYQQRQLLLEVFPPFECSLVVPLAFGDRVTGTLSLFGLTSRSAFEDHEIRLAQAVAYQIAVLIENSRLLDERERQIAELAALGQIGQIMTASYDLDQMFEAIYQVFLELTNATIFSLLLFDIESELITNAIFVEDGKWFSLDLVGRKLIPNSFSDWIMRQREPLLFDDLIAQTDEVERRGIHPPMVVEGPPPRSWVGVPVVARDGEMMGVLMLQDRRPYRFDNGTIDFLNQVTSHISLGVQKVRLFQERERLLRETRSHARAAEMQAYRIALVHRISTLLASSLDLQNVLDLASRELVQLFEVDHSGTVIIENEEHGYVAAEYPLTGVVGMPLDMRDNVIVKHTNATRRPVIISDFDH